MITPQKLTRLSLVKELKCKQIFSITKNCKLFRCREALDEFAEMKEREERKASLEREEKKRDYQARKMHYLVSTKQVGLPVPDSPRKPRGPPARQRQTSGLNGTWLAEKIAQRRDFEFNSVLLCRCTQAPWLVCDSGFMQAATATLAERPRSAAGSLPAMTQHKGHSPAFQTHSEQRLVAALYFDQEPTGY